MNLQAIDYTVVIIYGVLLLVLAQWVSREKAGHQKDTQDYFLAGRALPWWAIGASLIAANISAEQIIGMSGSAYLMGVAIASYEWMAALTLIIVGKWLLPVLLKHRVYTVPQFLELRYDRGTQVITNLIFLVAYAAILLVAAVANAEHNYALERDVLVELHVDHDVDLVFELTGNARIAEQVREHLKPGQELVPASLAKVIWDREPGRVDAQVIYLWLQGRLEEDPKAQELTDDDDELIKAVAMATMARASSS